MKTNKKTIFLSILLFIFVIAALGIPFKNWWCNSNDDFHGLYLGYKAKTYTDVLNFFRDGHVNKDLGPTNIGKRDQPTTFFSTYYRPIHCILLSVQHWIFGTKVYYYFLVNVFIHAINTIIIFNIFLFFLNYFAAFLAALFFAFHPLIGYNFGDLVNIQYYLNVTLILLIFVFLKNYLDSNKIKFYLTSIILFSLSLFLRETNIVLPGIIFLGIYLYKNINNQFSIKSFLNQFWKNIIITLPFAISSLLFLIIRALLYPLNLNTLNQKVNATKAIFPLQRIGELQVLIYDALSFSWLPWGHKNIRGIIVLSTLSLFVWLFIKNSKKIHVLYFLFCAILLIWPAYLENYCSRYFYEISPFILITFVFLFAFYNGHFWRLKKITQFALSFYVIFLITFTIECFSQREKNMQICSNAINELIKHPKIHKKPICILGCPAPGLGYYIASLIWVLIDNPSHPVFMDASTTLRQPTIKTTTWKNVIHKYYDQNFIEIQPLKNGFRFITLNPQKMSFDLPPNHYSLGEKIINKTAKVNGSDRVTDFSLIIENKFLNQRPLFFTWDFELKKFVTIKLEKT